MLVVPYVGSPKNACALACYTMVAKYFFPEATFNQIAKISDWRKGYVVWAFKFWLWIMNKGIKVTDYDKLSLKAWAKEGLKGLKRTVPEKEFNYYLKNSYDLEGLTADIPLVVNHPNFTHKRQNPTVADLNKAVKEQKICEVVLDSHTLDNIDGFSLHRVVVLDINKDTVTFHDPRLKPRPYRKEDISHFKKAWLEKVSETELCIYSR